MEEGAKAADAPKRERKVMAESFMIDLGYKEIQLQVMMGFRYHLVDHRSSIIGGAADYLLTSKLTTVGIFTKS